MFWSRLHNRISACQTNVLLGLRLVEEVETFPGPTAEDKSVPNRGFRKPAAGLDESKARFKRWIIPRALPTHQCIGATPQRFIIFRTIAGELKLNSVLDIEAREWMS